MENQQTKRRSTIPKDQWEKWKPVIAHLYRDHTLLRVSEIMRDQHGFHAEEHMYKKRLQSWNLRKNYTPEQKLSAYTHIQQHGGVSGDDFLINGNSLCLSRTQRPVQRQGKKFLIVQSLPDAMQNTSFRDFQGQEMSSSILQSQVPGQNHDPGQAIAGRSFKGIDTLQKHILQESLESSTSELILRHISSYYRWYSVNPEAIYHHTPGLAEVFDIIDEGLNCLSTRKWLGFSKLNKACQGAKTLFKHQPFQITVQFSACFSQYKWSNYPEIQAALMRYLTQTSILVLGQDHYLPKILELMSREHTLTGLSSRVIRLTSDATLSKLQQSSADLLNCMPHLRLLADRMDRDTRAESALLSTLAEDVLIMNRLDNAASRDINLVYKLGYLRLSQNRLDKAEELLTEAIALADQSPEAGEASVSRVCMWTFNCMGVLFAKRGNLVERNRYYKLALERSSSVVPGALNQADRLRRVKWLEDVVKYYTLKGDIQEVQSLREEYGFLWAELDQEEFGVLDGIGASA